MFVVVQAVRIVSQKN